VGKTEICITHELLYKYSVLKTDQSNDVIKMLNKHKAVENKDYLLRQVAQQSNSGIKHAIEYTLHPRIFKKCLMRSQNESKYADYYIFLEECIKYYDDYQLQMKQNENKTLHGKLDYVINELKESKEQINKILNINERLEEKLDTVVDDRVIYPTDGRYKMVSGSNNYITNKMKLIKGDIILKLENVPNCYYLKVLIKENMADSYNFTNDTIIKNKSITEKKMISTIIEIYEERKNKDTV